MRVAEDVHAQFGQWRVLAPNLVRELRDLRLRHEPHEPCEPRLCIPLKVLLVDGRPMMIEGLSERALRLE